jgi:hypothetical protein
MPAVVSMQVYDQVPLSVSVRSPAQMISKCRFAADPSAEYSTCVRLLWASITLASARYGSFASRCNRYRSFPSVISSGPWCCRSWFVTPAPRILPARRPLNAPDGKTHRWNALDRDFLLLLIWRVLGPVANDQTAPAGACRRPTSIQAILFHPSRLPLLSSRCPGQMRQTTHPSLAANCGLQPGGGATDVRVRRNRRIAMLRLSSHGSRLHTPKMPPRSP